MQDKKLQKVGIIFKGLRSHYNLKTYRELAAFLGVKEGTLNAWKSRNSIGDIDLVLTKCKGVNYTWLKTGEGEMLSSSVFEPVSEYKVPSDPELAEIVDILVNDLPEAKSLVLKLLRGRKESKEALEAFTEPLKEGL